MHSLLIQNILFLIHRSEKIFVEKKINSNDNPAVIQTPEPVNEIINSIEYDPEKENSDSLKDKIDTELKNIGTSNPNSNRVVYINSTEFPFISTLKPNEFIKAPDNSIIYFQEGNLNLALNNGSNITVIMKSNNNADLLINGNGNLNLQLKENDMFIKLNSQSFINDTTTITVPYSVKRVSFESIQLNKKGKLNINSKSPNGDYHTNNNKEPTINESYTLLDGYFTNKDACKAWLDSIDFGNTGFDTIVCVNSENVPILTDFIRQNIVVRKTKPSDNGDDSNKDKDGGGGGGKLSAGAIAGIVIAIVVVIAIIIVVVIIIRKKKNSNLTNSEKEDAPEKDEI
ncbi:hypothetical protein M9Y10_030273 [Tritrichomonas musculus]|uniref:FecR protein domain-containing protein n=1 Tax=Tritrichomonas musculus TaxID=1915356 RepID=A0ABR2KQJ5_9EUKA